MTDRPGRFIVLEGVEGAGKSTQARHLSDWMSAQGVDHRLAREPGGTPVGEAIRSVLLDSDGVEIPSETELLLMLAARAAFVRDIVRPTLASGRVMVADRFELSTFVYQGVARHIGVPRVRELNAFATGGLAPDLTIVFDLPADEGQRRQSRAGKERDRIEGEGDDFLRTVRDAYADLAARDPRAVVVDAIASAEAVHAHVRELLGARFPELFGVGRGSDS